MREALDAGSLNLPELPAGWNYKAVSEIGAAGEQPVLTGPFGTNLGRGDFVPSGVPVLTIGCLTQGGINLDKALFISEDKAQELSRYRLKEGDLLFSRMASVGRAGLVTKQLEGALFNYHIMRLRLDEERVDARFFINYVRGAKQVRDYLKAVNHGATRDGINTEQLLGLPVAVAPPDEQRKIVAEIDKQFSRLDEAVANLHRVKANLKRYKAAILKAAVEGRLVETEASIARREGRGYETATELIAKTPTPPRPNRFNSRTGDVIYGHGALAVGIPPVSVPEGWQWVNLVEIAKMESGHTPSRNHPEWWDGDVPWIGIADARDHHEQVILGTLQSTNDDGLANSAARLLPAGTVCVSRTASVGYVVVMGKSMATSQDFVNWVPTSAVTSDWLRIVFSADREALIRFGKGSVHKTIYFPEWLSASIALPPLAEQVRIAAEVDRRVSVLRSVEAEVDANLRRAHALRQSVLAKSFQ